MNREKRKNERFLAQDNAFAALRSEFKKAGKINNISIKGLAFSYLSELIESVPDSNSSQVDIFLSEKNGFYLSHVPCKVVYDIPAPTFKKNHNVMRYHCGLHFGKLTTNQLEQLENLLKNHTIGLSSQ